MVLLLLETISIPVSFLENHINNIMDAKVLSFNENQLKKSGFGEAFTAELKEKMEQKVPLIQHKFQKEYERDRLEATLHLKKSSISDYYSLKKFDLQLQKEGLVDTVRHTFNITDTNFGTNQINAQHFRDVNRYTLQEAYNLLAGRSVYKNLINSDGKQEHAWIKLNLKNKSLINNEDNRLYQIKYGFDLEKILNNYSIKELKYERLRESLIQSLQRGNVKKVTFVGYRKQEEQLYISPNVTSGSLNVYDKQKQPLLTSELFEKKFMEKDLLLKIEKISGSWQRVEFKKQKIQEPTKKFIPSLKKTVNGFKSKKSHRL